MLTFSQRMGLVDVRKTIQTDSLDQATRNALWNVISPFFIECAKHCSVYVDIWTELYNNTSDTRPIAAEEYADDDKHFYMFYKKKIIDGKFGECMDLIEFMNQMCFKDKWWNELRLRGYYEKEAPVPESYNYVFERFMVGYRIIDEQIVPITTREEKESVEKAITKSSSAVAEQMSKALRFLSDRKKPDYSKSVDCSISAVESQCRILLNDPNPTLGKALKLLEDKGVPLHGSLKDGFVKLYGFTSNADGIRHAGVNPSNVDFDLAKFMLVSCSAFVNYLQSKGM